MNGALNEKKQKRENERSRCGIITSNYKDYMGNRTRAWRRRQTKRIQTKRLKIKQATWWGYIHLGKNHVGMLKKHNFGCGCNICKPWKNGCHDRNRTLSKRDKRLKHSERKQLKRGSESK